MKKEKKNKIILSQIIKENKKIFSIFPGSRLSEINVLTPILFDFVKKMNEKIRIYFLFSIPHIRTCSVNPKFLLLRGLKNCGAIGDEKIKSHILDSSIFAVSKSGTIS